MKLFSEILRGVGLSQSGAVKFLDVKLNTVKSWGRDNHNVPAGVLAELHEMATIQDRAAIEFVEMVERAADEGGCWPERIEFGVAADDYEAQQLGWPCVGAHLAVARRCWEMLPDDSNFVVVPRGSTLATAVAEHFVEF